MKKDSEVMARAFKLSVDHIVDVLEKNKSITDRTKVATTCISNYSRIKSTEVHEMGIKLMERKMSLAGVIQPKAIGRGGSDE